MNPIEGALREIGGCGPVDTNHAICLRPVGHEGPHRLMPWHEMIHAEEIKWELLADKWVMWRKTACICLAPRGPAGVGRARPRVESGHEVP